MFAVLISPWSNFVAIEIVSFLGFMIHEPFNKSAPAIATNYIFIHWLYIEI